MIRIKALLSITIIFYSSITFSQSLNQNWSDDLSQAVEEFKNCKNSGNSNVNPCSKYIGASLKTVYNVNDFYSDELNRYLTGTEIVKFLKSSSTWSEIGPAYTQENLDKAQETANSGKAVLAVYLGEDQLGHVSIILPGDQTASGSWGLKVPNSASFFMHSPQRSYLNKTLSYAFTRNMIKSIVIYSRK